MILFDLQMSRNPITPYPDGDQKKQI